ncbi:Multifunctional methyltransferase subunit TRM112 [Fasciola hepatica]|uniref:Multifunctional methyltransferase subunit TRM112-like protein n=1 Tax=Fasciola hepatica TaxID=6192 RepID=A0A4E0RRC3_FASHE|nr:Multifunctional methyltransferase subunit TRM112 [Fasciola hepatica]
MKLFLHNVLTSRVLKSVKIGYPLILKATSVKINEVDFDPSYISRLIPKVEWKTLKTVTDQLGEVHVPSLPEEIPSNYSENEDFLRLAHRALLELDVVEGVLVCPETGREFPISNGIPNMLVNEGE